MMQDLISFKQKSKSIRTFKYKSHKMVVYLYIKKLNSFLNNILKDLEGKIYNLKESSISGPDLR